MSARFQKHIVAATVLVGSLLSPAVLAEASGQHAELLKRGARLVVYGGCADCHTPSRLGPQGPEKEVARGLSGHPEGLQLPPPPPLGEAWNWGGSASMTAFTGPWGISYASNLTPDKATGIGAWREQDFIQAMRSGRHMGVARPILPPMPWQAIGSLPDKDLRALYAYLMAQPAVSNKVPEPQPPAGR